MKINFGYAKENISFQVEEKFIDKVLMPNDFQTAEVLWALENPCGTCKLSKKVNKGEKVVIITSDITRPVPSYIILPPILDELNKGGIPDEDITIVLALGSHRGHTQEEKEKLLGKSVIERVNCIDHDINDCIYVGTSKHGTRIEIFKPVVEADRRICIGNIEYHYFAGYSGGAKAILPGVASRNTIQDNHSMMLLENAASGEINTNPIRQDIDDVNDFVPIDYIVNVVLDDHKNIIRAFAGNYITAHREGCYYLDKIYKSKINSKADVVIATAGGFPKDINIYQAQKALDNASRAVRDGGIIIWVASCAEGFGEDNFKRWMTTKEPEQMINDIKTKFELGGHKAVAIMQVLQKADIFLVSDLPKELVEKIHLKPFDNIEEAINKAREIVGQDARMLVLPLASSTLPILE